MGADLDRKHVHTVTIAGRVYPFTDRFGPYFAEDNATGDQGGGDGGNASTDQGDQSQAQGDQGQGDQSQASGSSDTGGQGGDQSQASDQGDGAQATGDQGGDASASSDNAPAIPEVPEDLTTIAGEDDLRSLYDGLEAARVARLETVASDEDAEAIELIVLAQDRVVTNLNERIAEATRVAERADNARNIAPPALPEERIPSPARAAAAAAASDAGGASSGSSGDSGGATTRTAPAARTDVPERTRVAMLAAIGDVAVPAGGELTMQQLMIAYERNKAAEGRTILASVPDFSSMADGGDESIPEPLSQRNGAPRNTELIHEAVADWRARRMGETPARQGAICTPLDIIREIPDAFNTDTRVGPTFPQRPISRLGFTYTPSAVLADVVGGANIWTETQQNAVDPNTPSTWKGIVDFACGNPVDVKALFVVWGARIDMMLEMSSPERVQNLENALQALRSRRKEGRTLNLLDATLGKYVWPNPGYSAHGALPSFVYMLNALLANLPHTNRLSETGFTVVIPPGLPQALVSDVAHKNGTDTNVVRDVLAEIQAGVDGVSQIVGSLDGTDAGAGEPSWPMPVPRDSTQAQAAVPSLDGSYRVRIYDPSGYIYGETGELNVGTYRGPDEIRQNKSILFGEEGLLLAKHGPQAGGFVDVSVCVNGQRAGNVAAVACGFPS